MEEASCSISRQDIGETRDLRASQSEVSARLTALMQRYIDRGRSTDGPPQKNEFSLKLWSGAEGGKKSRKRTNKSIEKN